MRRYEVVKQIILRAEIIAESEEEAEAWADQSLVDFRVTQESLLTSLTKEMGPAPEPELAHSPAQLLLPGV